MTLLTVLLAATLGWSQTPNIKDIPVSEETTISVKKGAKAEKVWEIVRETVELTGDAAVLQKEAKANWKTACADWKKETKELNSENKVIALNCGKMKCAKADATETQCESQASMTIKVKVQ